LTRRIEPRRYEALTISRIGIFPAGFAGNSFQKLMNDIKFILLFDETGKRIPKSQTGSWFTKGSRHDHDTLSPGDEPFSAPSFIHWLAPSPVQPGFRPLRRMASRQDAPRTGGFAA
jgi:hypothetical protein